MCGKESAEVVGGKSVSLTPRRCPGKAEEITLYNVAICLNRHPIVLVKGSERRKVVTEDRKPKGMEKIGQGLWG